MADPDGIESLQGTVEDLQKQVARLTAQLKPVAATAHELAEDKRRAILAERRRREKLDEVMAGRVEACRDGLKRVPGLMRKAAKNDTPAGIKKLAQAHMCVIADESVELLEIIEMLDGDLQKIAWASWYGTRKTLDVIVDFLPEMRALYAQIERDGEEILATLPVDDVKKGTKFVAENPTWTACQLFKYAQKKGAPSEDSQN